MGILTTPPMEREERILWREGKSLTRYALGIAACVGLPLFVNIVSMGFAAPAEHSSKTWIATAVSVLGSLFLSWWFFVRGGVRFLLTNQRVIRIHLFGSHLQMAVETIREIRHFERTTQYYRRYDPLKRIVREEIKHLNIVFFLDDSNRGLVFYYPANVQGLDTLLQGQLGRYRVLDDVPALGVDSRQAYYRSDVFFSRNCLIDGVEYGPLYVSDNAILRFSGPLESARMRELERYIASHLPPERLDGIVRSFRDAENPALEWSWSSSDVRSNNAGLVVPIDTELREIQLEQADIARFQSSRFSQRGGLR